LLTNKKNINDQEPGLILIGNFIEKGVIDKNMSLQYMQLPKWGLSKKMQCSIFVEIKYPLKWTFCTKTL
jgi:hypothetical protein